MATAEEYQSSEELVPKEVSSTLRGFRTEYKQSIEKEIEEIQTHIVNRGSRSALAIMRKHLASSLEKLNDVNQRYIKAAGYDGPQRKNRELYFTLVEKQTSACFLLIEEYLTSRAAEPPSSRDSRSSKSVESSRSARSREHAPQLPKSTVEDFWPQVRQELIALRTPQPEAMPGELGETVQVQFRSVRPKPYPSAQLHSERSKTVPDQPMRWSPPPRKPDDRDGLQDRQEWQTRLERGLARAHLRIQQLDREIQSKTSNRPIASNDVAARREDLPPHGVPNRRPEERDPPPFASSSDAWIFEIDNERTNKSHSTSCSSHLSKLTIKAFNGDPREWPMFLAKFKSLVHNVVSDNAQRLAYLRELLAPHIQKSIAQTFLSPNLYPQALRELQERYGHPIIVSNAFAEDLINIQAVKTMDFRALERFFSELHGSVVTMQSAGYEQDLLAPSVLQQMRSKLPAHYRSLWGQEILKLQRMPNLLDFDEWLGRVVKGESFVQPTSVLAKPYQPPKETNANKAKDKGKAPTVLSTLAPSVSPSQASPPSSSQAPSLSSSRSCSLCQEEHRLPNCKKFEALTLEERMAVVKDTKSCFRCLIPGHRSRDCRRKTTCGTNSCKGRHHALLHGAPRANGQQSDASNSSKSDSSEEAPVEGHVCFTSQGHTVEVALLKVVPVQIHANGKCVDTFAVLDNGSEVSLIKQDMADVLGLQGTTRQVRLGTYHGRDPTFPSRIVNFEVANKRDDTTFVINKAYTVPEIHQSCRRVNWPREKDRWSYLADLPIESTDSSRVTILLGMTARNVHDQFDVRKPPPGVNGPEGILTPFGWCLAGAMPANSSFGSVKRVNLTRCDSGTETLLNLVENFWRTDSLVITNKEAPKSEDDERALRLLRDTTKCVNGRYESGLLWKVDQPCLPDNRSLAMQRFFTLERKLSKDPNLAEKYAATVEEYVRLGHARKLSSAEVKTSSNKTCYLPHHGVVHPLKPGKVRVVFDASARFKDTSLNDSLLKGPDLLTSSLGVLLRFRQNPIL